MTEIVGVRFKELGRVYSFDPSGEKYEKGTTVIVETARGIEYGALQQTQILKQFAQTRKKSARRSEFVSRKCLTISLK